MTARLFKAFGCRLLGYSRSERDEAKQAGIEYVSLEELLKESGKDYQGEVSFFAIDSRYRGMGLGKILFNALISYMESESVKDFYLFTDTSCNFGFYERQGMKRRGEKAHPFTLKKIKQETRFFMYDYQCR